MLVDTPSKNGSTVVALAAQNTDTNDCARVTDVIDANGSISHESVGDANQEDGTCEVDHAPEATEVGRQLVNEIVVCQKAKLHVARQSAQRNSVARPGDRQDVRSGMQAGDARARCWHGRLCHCVHVAYIVVDWVVGREEEARDQRQTNIALEALEPSLILVVVIAVPLAGRARGRG